MLKPKKKYSGDIQNQKNEATTPDGMNYSGLHIITQEVQMPHSTKQRKPLWKIQKLRNNKKQV
jgi:hypothetical protein